MSAVTVSKIIRHDTPGESRAVLLDANGRPCRCFLQRWNGAYDRARAGTVHPARLRAFSEAISGAFLDLTSGEEVFLRLKDRAGFTEGMALTVKVQSEARSDKLARVAVSGEAPQTKFDLETWIQHLPGGADLETAIDAEGVAAAFDEALASSITLPSGGHLHIDRTRALTAFDVDTSGRTGKGSAGARALAINREAVGEVIRQMALRGLGGLAVLDCIEPLNKHARDLLKDTAREACESYALMSAKALPPSALGLMEFSLPWTVCPIEDQLSADPHETELIELFRAASREAEARPTAFFEVQLSETVWQAYFKRRKDADAALISAVSGRITVTRSENIESRVQKR